MNTSSLFYFSSVSFRIFRHCSLSVVPVHQNNPFLLKGTELCNCCNASAGFADRAGVSLKVVVGNTASSVLGREERNYTS